MSHSQCTWSYNWGPFLCPGEAAVRQLQAVHRALPVSDEEHASDFPLHQRCCHYTLRAHAEVKSHCHHITSPVLPYQEPQTQTQRDFNQSVCGGSTNILVISHFKIKYWTFVPDHKFFQQQIVVSVQYNQWSNPFIHTGMKAAQSQDYPFRAICAQ